MISSSFKANDVTYSQVNTDNSFRVSAAKGANHIKTVHSDILVYPSWPKCQPDMATFLLFFAVFFRLNTVLLNLN